jgi:hypothetical protein
LSSAAASLLSWQYKPSHKRVTQTALDEQGPAMKRIFMFLVLALLATALLAAGLWLRREIAIDTCLDRGGAWNQVTGACVGATD